MRTTCPCNGCPALHAAEDIDSAGLCPECAYRYMEALGAGHDDDCGCAECAFVGAVGVEKMRRLAPEYAGPSGLPRYVREAAKPAPYAPRCSTGECDCGCDYLGADAL